MIKVLIIDDEPEGLQSAMAGLLPLSPKKNSDPDIENRIILAREVFDIRTAETITKAVEAIQNFAPDLVIIDIEIKKGQKSKHGGRLIENGIDLYRFLDSDYKETEKILFSNYGNVPAYINGLSIDERMNFISKAQDSGYEILAGRIAEYLKKVSVRLISGLQTEVKNNFSRALKNNDWEGIEYLIIQQYPRMLRSRHLALFASYPTYTDQSNQKTVLTFEHPLEELKRLSVLHQDDKGSGKNRAEWDTPVLCRMLEHLYEHKEKYFPVIDASAEKLIKAHIENTDKAPKNRLKEIMEYRLLDYIRKKQDFTNKRFLEKFLNALAVRRSIIFFESFIRENIDNFLLTPRGSMADFMQKMPNEIMQSAKQIGNDIDDTRGGFTQEGASLNLGFKISGNEDVRQVADIGNYVIHDFEREWLSSPKYQQLYTLLRNKILAPPDYNR